MAKRKPTSTALEIRDSLNGRTREPKATAPEDPILERARKAWNRCDEAEDAQRKSILAAKQFRAGDQWPEAIKIQRQGSTAIQGQAAQPPRPCLTIDRLSQPVRQVSNQIKSANFAIDVQPNGHGADDETAEIFTGILRRVQNVSRGESPIEWAADQAIEGGLGWFRIRTEYVHESADGVPDEALYDQEIRLERITNNLTVYCDPSAMRPTRSDAHFMLVTEDMLRDLVSERWPVDIHGNPVDLNSLDDFMATGDMPGWVDKDSIRIAEYWEVTYEDATFVQLTDGKVVPWEKAPAAGEMEKRGIVRWRTVRQPKVKGYKITATQVLEKWDWVGSRIPLIPILGEELNVDGKPVLRGIIQEGMDAQRMVNYTYSGAMEIFALGPKSPWVIAEGQVEGYEKIWQTANTFNYSYLPYKPVSLAGKDVPPPQRQTAEAPIEAAVALMMKSEEAIKATTGIYDPSLGNTNPREKSGRAIMALQGQSELGSSNFPDNVKRALIYAGELMVEILPKITRKGQILQIIGVDDKPEQIMVGVPFQAKGGIPQPVPEQEADELLKQGLAKFYDPAKGKYAVTVSIGKAATTKREEGAAALGELIPHLLPQQQAVIMPDYVEQLSFPGAHKIAEKLRKTLPPELQEQDDDSPIPPEVKQMLSQLKTENEQMKQMLQMDGVKEQADTERKKIDADTRITVAGIQAESALAVAEIKAGMSDLVNQVKIMQTLMGVDAKVVQQAQQANQQAQMADQTHQHALEQGAQAQQGQMVQGEQEHAQTLAQGQQGHQQAMEQTDQQGQQQAELERMKGEQAKEQAQLSAQMAMAQAEQQAKLAPKPASTT